MRFRRALLIWLPLVLASMASCRAVQQVDVPPVIDLPPTPERISQRTRSGPVNDEQTAIGIALDAWIPIFGREQIEDEKRYVATLKKGIWTVEGSLPEGWVGGVAMARISQKDGRVLKVIHGE